MEPNTFPWAAEAVDPNTLGPDAAAAANPAGFEAKDAKPPEVWGAVLDGAALDVHGEVFAAGKPELPKVVLGAVDEAEFEVHAEAFCAANPEFPKELGTLGTLGEPNEGVPKAAEVGRVADEPNTECVEAVALGAPNALVDCGAAAEPKAGFPNPGTDELVLEGEGEPHTDAFCPRPDAAPKVPGPTGVPNAALGWLAKPVGADGVV